MARVMIGRESELATVLRSLSDPEVAMTLLVGDAGIGKSCMVGETVAASPQRLTLTGACLPMRHALPLLPVVDALDTTDPAARRALTRAARMLPVALRPHLAGLMPRTSPEDIHAPVEVRREELFLACEALLSRAAEEQPVTLVVEDLHWADPDTLDLLTYLAGARRSIAMHLLITCRADETRIAEPVTDWLETQRHSSAIREVRLGPLGAEEVHSLVASLPRPDGIDIDMLASEVFARGEGNPFFTEQLVAAAADGERLPTGLTRLLSARVRAVSPAAREAITALAVVGRPIALDGLRLVTRHDEETCLAAVRELETASLVGREDGGFRPRHALLAEALVQELPGVPASYHRGVAAALQSLDDPATAPEVAEHLRRGGDEEAELRVVQIAAQRAWDLGADAEAARWYRRTAELHARHPHHELTVSGAEMTRRLLRALYRSGARLEATEVAEHALVDFAGWPDVAERLKLLSQCVHLVSVKDPTRAERLYQGLLAEYESLPPSADHAYALSWITSIYTVRGDYEKAYELMAEALSLTEGVGEPREQAHVHLCLGGLMREMADRRAADRHTATAVRIAAEAGDEKALLDALVAESDNRLKYAEYEEALASAQRGLAIVTETRLERSFPALVVRANAAEALLAMGRTREAASLVDELTQRSLRPDDDVAGDLNAHVDVLRGDPAGAAAWLRDDNGMLPSSFVESTRARGETLAFALLWDHRPDEAFDVVVATLEPLAPTKHSSHAGRLLALGARAVADLSPHAETARATTLDRLQDLRMAMRCDPFADRDTLARAAADKTQWDAELTRVQGGSDVKAWQRAAHAWEALSMPHDAGYCWWRAAEAMVATGATNDAVRDALRAAHRLANEHVPLRREIVLLAATARMPIVEDTPTHSGRELARDKRLTAQETKVLQLLAAGLTNAEIGTTLFISPKTASVHVSHILRKLGMTNRTEAAAWATRNGFTLETDTPSGP